MRYRYFGSILEPFEELNNICTKVQLKNFNKNWRDCMTIPDLFQMDLLIEEIKFTQDFSEESWKELNNIKFKYKV